MIKSKIEKNIESKHVMLLGINIILIALYKPSAQYGLMIISDITFLLGISFLIVAMGLILGNLGLLDIVKYSFRNFYFVLKNRDDLADYKKLTYADYKKIIKKDIEYKTILYSGIALLFLSVLIYFILN